LSDFAKARLQLNALTVYRNLLTDETVSRFLRLLEAAESGDAASFCAAYGAFFKSLSEQNSALDFAEHLQKLVHFDDNAFSRAVSTGAYGKSFHFLHSAAVQDLLALRTISSIGTDQIIKAFQSANGAETVSLPAYACYDTNFFTGCHVDEIINDLERYHCVHGYGVFAQFDAFHWDGGLVGIAYPDPVRLKDLKEYEYERGLVEANTLDFVEGRGGGNLLLYGDRGTGKSSTIKALANEYKGKGLRIVEITRDRISDLPAVLECLRGVPQRFILFLDDLSFSSDNESFSALKSILEGGLVSRPENCRVYATSNRRHLVKESFAERDVNDVHAGDTMQEKLSLYDRFDQTVNFFAPDQARYLAIVSALAQERNLIVSQVELERGAVQWAIRAGGRSPRTAKQYVEWAHLQTQKGESISD